MTAMPLALRAVFAVVLPGTVAVLMPLLEYAGFAWAAFHLFVIYHEETALDAKFGASYRACCRAVPRWGFRLPPRSWTAGPSTGDGPA